MTDILEVLDKNTLGPILCYVCWEEFDPGPKPTDLMDPELVYFNVCSSCKAKYPDRKELFKVRVQSLQERRAYLRSLPGPEGAFHRMLDNQPRSLPSGLLFQLDWENNNGEEQE